MGRKEPRVLIADDEEEFRSAFVAKHDGQGFVVEQLTNSYAVPEYLRTARRVPDLVVLDLYRTTADPDSDQAKVDNAEVDRLLAKLETVTSELKAVVDRVKTPAAIKILREIRMIPRLSEVPVLLYTRQGLSLLSDNEIRDATHLGAEWMLKGHSADVEQAQMCSFLRDARARRPRIKRDVILTVVGAILGVAIGALAQVAM